MKNKSRIICSVPCFTNACSTRLFIGICHSCSVREGEGGRRREGEGEGEGEREGQRGGERERGGERGGERDGRGRGRGRGTEG